MLIISHTLHHLPSWLLFERRQRCVVTICHHPSSVSAEVCLRYPSQSEYIFMYKALSFNKLFFSPILLGYFPKPLTLCCMQSLRLS